MKASIVIVNWNGRQHLEDCLNSLTKQTYANYEIIVVDNASEDDSVPFIKKNFPTVRIIHNPENIGFAEGSNIGIRASTGEYIVLLNNDTSVEPNWLEELVKAVDKDEKIGACMSKILLFDRRNVINSSGGEIHYLGFAWASDYGTRDNGQFKEREIAFASGAAMLIKRQVLNKVGLFDPAYHMYYEDVDLGWRIRLAGYKIVFVPSSVVYHKYEFSKGIQKFYNLEKNRLSLLLTHYKTRTLFLIVPVFFLMEAGLLLYFLLQSGLGAKLRSYLTLVRDLREILEKRKRVQALRAVNDGDIARVFTSTINFKEINNPLLTYIGNPLLAAYRRVISI